MSDIEIQLRHSNIADVVLNKKILKKIRKKRGKKKKNHYKGRKRKI